jgi:heme/copper-type cytochrome/quinol oxidase subunit 3
MKAAATGLGRLDTKDRNVLGMGSFLANEAVFFALLIIAYVNFRNSVTSGPTASSSLDPLRSGIFTVFLLSSSLTLWFADRSLERGDRRWLVAWLGVTVTLGSIFLVGQGLEYARLLSSDVTVSRNVFGTTFFTLTGFHGLHVLVGLIMLSILAGLALTGDLKERRSGALGAVSLYWHFVDVVWIVIFGVVYLWTLIS